MSKGKTSQNASGASENADAEKNKEEKKSARFDLYRMLMMSVRRMPYALLPKFPHDLQLVSDDTHTLKWHVADERQTLVPLEQNVMWAMIAQYLNNNDYFNDQVDWHWLPKTIKDFCEFATMNQVPIEPKLFKFIDEKGYSYATIPFARPGASELEIPTPHFDEILSRMSAPEAFASWVGSLFDQETDNNQYVWMQGKGGDSKGAINRLLKSVFQNVYFSQKLEKQDSPNQFWTQALAGKRVVVFPDTDAVNFPSTGLFKNLTGGEDVHFERKYGAQGNITPKCKYLFFSQHRPKLNFDSADRRRIIYVEIESVKGQIDLNFQDKLNAETRGIIAKCIQAFEDTKRYDYGTILTKNDSLWEWESVINEDFEVLLEDYFEMNPHENVPAKVVATIIERRWPNSRKTGQEFRQFLEKIGCKKGTCKGPDGKTYKGWKGIRQKPAYERNRT